MTPPLIEALAAHLSITPEAAADALAEFSADVRRRVSRDGEAVVPGLGIFRRHVGALVFEPDERLALAVNHRFAGLGELVVDAGPEPHNYRKTEFVATPEEDSDAPADEAGPTGDGVEAREAALPPEGAVAPPPPEAPPERPDADAEAEPEPEPVSYAAAPDDEAAPAGDEPDDDTFSRAAESVDEESVDEETPGGDEDEEPPFWEMETESLHPLGPRPDTYEEADFHVLSTEDGDDEARPAPPLGIYDSPAAPPTIEDEPSATDDEPPADEAGESPAVPWTPREPEPEVPAAPAAPPPPRTRRTTDRDDDDGRSRIPLIAAAVVVLIAVVAVFFLLPGDDPVPATPPGANPAPVAADTAVASPDTSALAALPEDPAIGDETPPEPAAEAAEPPPADAEPASPLRGGAIDVGTGGYALVVSSWTEPGTAEEEAAALRAEGFRAGVLSETSGGVTRYRVAVGQYPTLEAADEARASNADVLPSGVWVLRIR